MIAFREKIRDFVFRSFGRGLLILLPLAVIVVLFIMLMGWIIVPLADFTQEYIPLSHILAGTMSFFVLLFLVVLIGMLGQTNIGERLVDFFDRKILGKIPSYKKIRGILSHFQQLALVQLDKNSDNMALCFITKKYPASKTVEIVLISWPVPTTNFPCIVPEERVRAIPEIPPEKAMGYYLADGNISLDPIVDRHIQEMLTIISDKGK